MSRLDLENPLHARLFLAAAGTFLTEWPDDWTAGQLEDALCEEELHEDVTVWQPFEGWETGAGDQSLRALIANSVELTLQALPDLESEEPLKAYLTEISVRWGEQVVDRKHVIRARSEEEAATETLHKEVSYVGCEPHELDEQSNGWYSGTMEHFFHGPIEVTEIHPKDAPTLLCYFQ